MRVSKVKAAENRLAILDAASRLFRERGVDGTGVAEIAKEAGLTHGALYAHFPSKDMLAAEAFSHGFAGNMALIRAWDGDGKRTFDDYLGAMFSTKQRDNLAAGCPMTASASEVARQGGAVCTSFKNAFEEMVEVLERSLGDEVKSSERRRIAVAALAAQIGAIAVARATAETAPSLSKEVLRSVRDTVQETLPVRSAKEKKRHRK
jgi:TetR/AcrR family transcriptional repressor of nem operon